MSSETRRPMYEVFWSADGKRVAISFQGYLMAGYDLESHQAIELKREGLPYKECDFLLQRFLAGESITNEELEELHKLRLLQVREKNERSSLTNPNESVERTARRSNEVRQVASIL